MAETTLNIKADLIVMGTRDAFVQGFQPISDAARNAHTSLTRHPDFWDFYRAVTPLDVIEGLPTYVS